MLKQQIGEEVRNVRNSLCRLSAIVLCVAIVPFYEILILLAFSSLLYLGLIYKIGKYLHL